jgi:hypothetical protein
MLFEVAPDITQNFAVTHDWSLWDHSNQLLVARSASRKPMGRKDHTGYLADTMTYSLGKHHWAG